MNEKKKFMSILSQQLYYKDEQDCLIPLSAKEVEMIVQLNSVLQRWGQTLETIEIDPAQMRNQVILSILKQSRSIYTLKGGEESHVNPLIFEIAAIEFSGPLNRDMEDLKWISEQNRLKYWHPLGYAHERNPAYYLSAQKADELNPQNHYVDKLRQIENM